MQLFSYLTDKDLFAEIYRNQLAKRLLNQRSASDGGQHVGKLKLRCGSQFTGKMVRARRPCLTASAPSPRRIGGRLCEARCPLRRSMVQFVRHRRARRWRMGGNRRRRRDISTHTSVTGRRVDREALTVLYQRRRAC